MIKMICRGVMLLSAMTLALTSCSRGMASLDIAGDMESEETPERGVFTFTVSLPPNGSNEAKTRLNFDGDNYGIKTTWNKNEDELLLFVTGENENSQAVVAKIQTVSSDMHKATFEVNLFKDWVKGACHVYGLLQNRSPNLQGGQDAEFPIRENEKGERYFEIKTNEDLYSSYHTSNPAMWFDQKLDNIEDMGKLNISLQHCGYLLAIHIKNTNLKEDLMIKRLEAFTKDSKDLFFPEDNVKIMVKTGTCTTTKFSDHISLANRDGTTPFMIIKSGQQDVLYHWLPYIGNQTKFPELDMLRLKSEKGEYPFEVVIPSHTIEKGKVYHLFLEWNDALQDFKLVKRS